MVQGVIWEWFGELSLSPGVEVYVYLCQPFWLLQTFLVSWNPVCWTVVWCGYSCTVVTPCLQVSRLDKVIISCLPAPIVVLVPKIFPPCLAHSFPWFALSIMSYQWPHHFLSLVSHNYSLGGNYSSQRMVSSRLFLTPNYYSKIPLCLTTCFNYPVNNCNIPPNIVPISQWCFLSVHQFVDDMTY